MNNIAILSPHFDDGVLSCGELIKRNVNGFRDTTLITVFGGYPHKNDLSSAARQYHSNCFLSDDAMEYRRNEDKNACDYLGCKFKHLDYYECLYRKDKNGRQIYPHLSDIYHLAEADDEYCTLLERELLDVLEQYTIVYAPLGIGGHADHILLSKVIKRIAQGKNVYFYEDVPYLGYDTDFARSFNLQDMTPVIEVFSNSEWEAKVNAILYYRSQLHIMWKNEYERILLLRKISFSYGKKHSLRFWKMKDES